MATRHITRWQDTQANIRSNADAGQLGLDNINWYCSWIDNPKANVYFSEPNFSQDTGTGTVTYLDGEYDKFTVHDDTDGLLVAKYIRHLDDTDTRITFGDAEDVITIECGAVNMIEFTEDTQDTVVINEDGGDVDFRVEASGVANALFVQGSDGNVGIGTNAPSSMLEVKDSGYRGGITLEASGSSVDRGFLYIGDGTNSTLSDEVYFDAYNSAFHFRTGATGTDERFTILQNGDVGIGQTSPTAGLFVQKEGASAAGRLLNVYSDNGSFGGGAYIAAIDSVRTDNSDYGLLHLKNATGTKVVFRGDGNVGIGTSNPGNRLDIVTGATTNSAVHIGEALDEGGYITSIADSNAVLSAGAEYVSGSWTARATSATSIDMSAGEITFRANTGLTDGNVFSFTGRAVINETGLGVGTTPGNTLDVVTGATTSSAVHIGEALDEGGYITSIDDSQVIMSGGAEYVASSWIARTDSGSSQISMSSGVVEIYCNSSTTDGNSFTPTQIADFDSTAFEVNTGFNLDSVEVNTGTTNFTPTISGKTTVRWTPGSAPGGDITITLGSGEQGQELQLIMDNQQDSSGATISCTGQANGAYLNDEGMYHFKYDNSKWWIQSGY